jgi:hypothetical protein
MEFRHVRLQAPAHLLPELREFYERLGTGGTDLEFAAGEGEPFYHFAFLASEDRFEEARASADLLAEPETGDVVFDFTNWDARGLYFHDPAGNIVELVTHEGLSEDGLSELGLVGDTHAMAAELRNGLGLEIWSGTLDDPERLAFVGEQGRTLILARPGRGWFPTGRPAERHPVEAELSGPADGEVELEGGLYRLASRRLQA